jgi:hypothetical protein
VSYTLAFALQLRKKHGKTLVRSTEKPQSGARKNLSQLLRVWQGKGVKFLGWETLRKERIVKIGTVDWKLMYGYKNGSYRNGVRGCELNAS